MGRRGILVVVAVVAVLSAVLGWAAGQRIKSPAEVAAEREPPPPSLISVPVEQMVLSDDLVIRGTLRSADTTELPPPAVDGSTIITRLPLEAGDPIEEGDVVAEVAGRPIFALQGELPVFRNLIPTLKGPDVLQLEQALARLGYDPGDVDDTYTSSTVAAVATFYRDRGYTPPAESESESSAVTSARGVVKSSEDAVDLAQSDLDAAKQPLPESERIQLDITVLEREAAVVEAKDARTAAGEAKGPVHDLAVQKAEAELTEARAARDEALKPTDTKALSEKLDEAKADLETARTELAAAESKVGAIVPASELVFLATTPSEVQTVAVDVGDAPTTSIMTIAGSASDIDAGISSADRRLISEGLAVIIEDDGLGIAATGVISFIADKPGGGELSNDRYALTIKPDEELPPEALNVSFRLSIAVSSSEGEVLVVPLAALSAGADGSSRIELERADGETELVNVSAGLSAGGLVEISPIDATVVPGDRVIVGRNLELPNADGGSSEESDEDEPAEDDTGEALAR